MKQKTTLDKYFEQIPAPVRQIVNEVLLLYVGRPNDLDSRIFVEDSIKPALRYFIADKDGCWDVWCDSVNNPPDAIERNELWVTFLEQNTGESFDVGICPGPRFLVANYRDKIGEIL